MGQLPSIAPSTEQMAINVNLIWIHTFHRSLLTYVDVGCCHEEWMPLEVWAKESIRKKGIGRRKHLLNTWLYASELWTHLIYIQNKYYYCTEPLPSSLNERREHWAELWFRWTLLLENYFKIKKDSTATSLAVHWLRCLASTVESVGLIPGQGTKISHATWYGQLKNNFLKSL